MEVVNLEGEGTTVESGEVRQRREESIYGACYQPRRHCEQLKFNPPGKWALV